MTRQKFKTSRVCSSDNYRQSRKLAAYYRSKQSTTDTMDVSSHRCHVKDLIAEGKHPYVRIFGKLTPLTISEAAKVCDIMDIVWE